MAQCAYCSTETELYEMGTPICVTCAAAKTVVSKPSVTESEIRHNLMQEVRRATERVDAAAERVDYIIKDIPSAVPHPDGTLRIKQATRELATAREDVGRAQRRLDEFLTNGVIPEDFKAS